MHNMPLYYYISTWKDWCRLLTETMDSQMNSFLTTMLGKDESAIPTHTMIILQLSNKQGGMSMFNLSHQSVLNFMISMSKVIRSVSDDFCIAHGTEPIYVHPSLSTLFKT